MGAVTVQLLRSKHTVQNGCVLCYAGGDCVWSGSTGHYIDLPSQAVSACEEETASLSDRDPAGGHGGQGSLLYSYQHRLQSGYGASYTVKPQHQQLLRSGAETTKRRIQ